MDGLSGGVAFLASVFFLFAAVQIKMYFVSATLAVLAGALLGFLYYNFNPARIYMGDAGSMFIGYLLAVMTVESTFYQWTSSKTYFPLLMPIIVLAIPIYEMTTVIWVRITKGISPFKPSKDHLSYRLASLGLSIRGAVVFVYFPHNMHRYRGFASAESRFCRFNPYPSSSHCDPVHCCHTNSFWKERRQALITWTDLQHFAF